MQNKKDAFGNDLVIGSLYGYANNTKGVVSTFYGTLDSITKAGSGKIIIDKSFSAYYRADVTETYRGTKSACVKASLLMPLGGIDTYPTLEVFISLLYNKVEEGLYENKIGSIKRAFSTEQLATTYESLKDKKE